MKAKPRPGGVTRKAVAAAVAAILLIAPAAWSEAGSRPDTSSAPPQTDIMDVVRRLRHKEPKVQDATIGNGGQRTVILTPFLNYDPVTSVVFGVGALTSIFHGDPLDTFPSTVQLGGSISVERQMGVSAKLDYYSDGNRWFFQANPAWAKYPQSAYDLGTDSPDSSKVGVDLYIYKVLLSLYRQILPDVFTGIGLQYVTRRDIEPMGGSGPVWERSAFVEHSREHGFDLTTQTSAGVSGNLLFDRRDNPVNASRGWFANASYRTFSKDFLGGTSDWQEIYVDLRTYRSLEASARHKLALWLYGDFVTDGVAPYFDLPATGAVTRGRAGRGYDASRFRGERMVYAEIEYRVSLTRNGLLGAVAFLNSESFRAADSDDNLLDTYAIGGGAGLRVLLDKRARSNVCFDVGLGKGGSRGLWAGFQEAF